MNINEFGTLYGVGVGPGNPEWLTLEAARLLGQTRHVFAPRARIKQDSLALDIARPHLHNEAVIHELVFPMSKSQQVLDHAWTQAAQEVLQVLESGQDVCFITLGDAMLYSTFIYLQRAVLHLNSDVCCRAIPGIPAFVAAASLAEIPLGEGRRPLVVVPASGDLGLVDWALQSGGTTVMMKVGDRLSELKEHLQQEDDPRRAVLVSHAGLQQQQIQELDLSSEIVSHKAYLSVLLVEAQAGDALNLGEEP